MATRGPRTFARVAGVRAARGARVDLTSRQHAPIFEAQEVAGSPIFKPTPLKPGPAFAADATPSTGRRNAAEGSPTVFARGFKNPPRCVRPGRSRVVREVGPFLH